MPSKTLHLTKKNNRSKVYLKVGDTVKLQLPVQLSAGYSWLPDDYFENKHKYNPSDIEYSTRGLLANSDVESDLSAPGAPAVQMFTLRPTQPGNYEFKLINARPFEGPHGAPKFSIKLIVSL